MKIYLSPSRQKENRYAEGETHEAEVMGRVSGKILEILHREYGVQGILADPNLGIETSGRPKEAVKQGCQLYVALHSNAGGKGKAAGAVAFYHPKYPLSRKLAEVLVEELDRVCPVPSNRAQSVLDGMKAFQGKGYGEIRNPALAGLVPVLAETNFHDHPEVAHWMRTKTEEVAQAYVAALAKVLELKKRDSSKSGPELYRVQVGAFSQRKNAEALRDQLKEKGYPAFITRKEEA
ncbi:N-acetylmuramoyl-L-alanine amidase [Proteiniclasticum sp. BAD-10]|uniref:N-acetylmuramoyl-L-alanine amidase n=1 Tax=Proteiniclasticum sediminis TaxID=2804028 RepID=A0A941HRC4_9CLOT|nr:N-acetylmuramoyl-L-alanine amidase [Proteiniclasticum sediminis]MBR0576087.1 N-acetylmuramoyl-L-alanine amidase [Proteiniclasticum sediminis]